jgi:hypothetical protein
MLGESTNWTVMEVSGAAPLAVRSRFSPLAQFLGSLLLDGPQFGEQRQRAGVNLIYRQGQRALILADQKPGATAWRFGHIGAALGHEQVDAGAGESGKVSPSSNTGCREAGGGGVVVPA